jgi:hypothetical protein
MARMEGVGMKVEMDPRDLVRDVVLSEYRPRDEDSIQIVREKKAGKDAAFAVAFEDRNGVQRRGLVGLCRHHSDTWRPSGGYMGSTRVTGDEDVWMTWGGWGSGDSDSPERSVAGGWVADPTAVCARLVDQSGRVLDDDVEHGVFLFMWKGNFDLRSARLELLDADNRITRRGPLRRDR